MRKSNILKYKYIFFYLYHKSPEQVTSESELVIQTMPGSQASHK